MALKRRYEVPPEETVTEVSKSKRKMSKKDGSVWFFLCMIVICSFFLLGRAFLFDINVVSGLSMYPTLSDDDYLVVEKYDFHISRYDIVTLEIPDDQGNPMRIVKRIYGLPGEKIEIYSDGSVWIDGIKLPDEWQVYQELEYANPVLEYEVTLKPNEYYVLGDNRDISMDSRSFGPVKEDQIRGIVSFRVFPLKPIGDEIVREDT